jgi:hypothetical protein
MPFPLRPSRGGRLFSGMGGMRVLRRKAVAVIERDEPVRGLDVAHRRVQARDSFGALAAEVARSASSAA